MLFSSPWLREGGRAANANFSNAFRLCDHSAAENVGGIADEVFSYRGGFGGKEAIRTPWRMQITISG